MHFFMSYLETPTALLLDPLISITPQVGWSDAAFTTGAIDTQAMEYQGRLFHAGLGSSRGYATGMEDDRPT